MAEQRLELVIEASDHTKSGMDSARNSLDDLKGKVQAMGPTFTKMAGFGTAAFAGIAAFSGMAVKTYMADMKDMALANSILEKSVNSLSDDAYQKLSDTMDGLSGNAIERLKTKMEEAGQAALQLGFDDEAGSVSFAKLFNVTQDVAQAQSDMKLAMDLARFSGRDLDSAVQAVIMTHAGGTKILKEFGIEVDKDTTAAEALALAQQKVGGTAEAMGATTQIQMEKMALQWENIKSAIGAVIIDALEPLIQKLVPLIEKTVKWAEENPKLIATILAITAGIAALVAGLGFLGLVLPLIITGFTLLLGPVGLVILAIAAVTAATILLVKNWEKIKEFFAQTWDGIKIIFNEGVDAVMAKLQPLLNFLEKVKNAFDSVIQKSKEVSSNAWNSTKNFLGFDDGGVVPGAIGAPRLALVHGGETILPTHKRGFTVSGGGGITLNLSGNTFMGREGIAEQIGDDIINILKRSRKL